MSALLMRSGSLIPLSAVYGLFYGCLAATRLVVPSHYMPLIFGNDGILAESEEEMREIVGNLMSLWNMLAEWEPEGEYFCYPESGFSNTREGLKARISDRILFLDYFIKGLDLGETDETDFSEDGAKALKFLAEAGVFLQGYEKSLEEARASDTSELDETLRSIDQLEEVIEDCITRINLGLKGARMGMLEGRSVLPEDDVPPYSLSRKKVGRNDPCPCGSGKKYKKCCWLH